MRSSRSAPDALFAGPAGFAHRGLHGAGACENSMAAFRAALAEGVGIECDLRLSRDGIAVAFHDPHLDRLCGVDGATEAHDAAALTALRLGGGHEPIPRLDDVLRLVAGRVPLLLELKRRAGGREASIDRLCEATLAALDSYAGPVGVMSFDPRAPAWFKRHAPHVRRGLVIADRLTRFERWVAMTLADPDFLAIDRAALHRRWVARARARRPVASWTIRSRAERTMAQPRADALIWEDDGRPRI